MVEVVRQLESAPMEKMELVELDRQDVKWERQKGVGMGVGLESRFEDGKCMSTLGRTSSRALVPRDPLHIHCTCWPEGAVPSTPHHGSSSSLAAL